MTARHSQQKRLEPIVEPLLSWYRRGHRDLPWRQNPHPYRVWVSEIMLQQTRVEAVKPYYERFLHALPTVQALADCPEEQLLKLWEGLGYYSRVRNLQKAAQQIVSLVCFRQTTISSSSFPASAIIQPELSPPSRLTFPSLRWMEMSCGS